MTVARLASAGAVVGESPLWLPDERVWLWLDLQGRTVHRFDPATSTDRVIASGFAEDLACLARWTPGACLLVSVTGFHRLDAATGATAPIPCPVALPPGTIFNDGKADRTGALWLGSSDRAEAQPLGRLWRVTPDGAEEVARGFVVSNGPAFAPDGTAAYFADTFARRILRFALRGGHPGAPDAFAAIPEAMGYPDGLTVDAAGHLWVGHWDGARVTRWSPEGRLLDNLPMPARNVTSLAFGGADLRDVLVTTAALGATGEGFHGDPLGFRAAAPGLAEPALAWPARDGEGREARP